MGGQSSSRVLPSLLYSVSITLGLYHLPALGTHLLVQTFRLEILGLSKLFGITALMTITIMVSVITANLHRASSMCQILRTYPIVPLVSTSQGAVLVICCYLTNCHKT